MDIVTALVFSVTTLLAVLGTTDDSSFFPTRPPSAHVLHVEGVLDQFSIGVHAGSLKVLSGGRRLKFFVAATMSVDGKRIVCRMAPTPAFKPARDVCPDWPPYLRVHRSRVRVSYWFQPYGGRLVAVSDSMAVVGRANRRPVASSIPRKYAWTRSSPVSSGWNDVPRTLFWRTITP